MGSQLNVANQVIIFSIFAMSLNLLMGYAGQASIAHAAFGAVGGYTVALLSIHVGVPFLLFIFGDDDTGTWPHMAPLVVWWVAAALLGAACATAVVRAFGRGGAGARRIGMVSAIATVIVVSVLIATSFSRAPLVAVFGALLALANVAAARVLIGPDPVEVADDEPEIVFLDEAEAEAWADEDEDEEPAEPRVTVDLPRTGPGRGVPSAARRRLRGKAAMQTHAGVRLSRRARR